MDEHDRRDVRQRPPGEPSPLGDSGHDPRKAGGAEQPPQRSAPADHYREYLIVTGGRDFRDAAKIYAALDALLSWAPKDALVIVQGGCKTGADCFAREWAVSREVDFETYPAKWRKEGDRAGPLRNQRMLVTILARKMPVMVLAAPGNRGMGRGTGTGDMVWRARAAGVAVSPLDDPMERMMRNEG